MSRIGKKPVVLEKDVQCQINGNVVKLKGKLGELEYELPAGISVKTEENNIILTRPDDSKKMKAFHGLARSIVNNNVIGVSKGYEIVLTIVGVGLRAQMKGNDLQLQMGYSHPVIVDAVPGIKFEVEGTAKIKVSGIDKHLVGQIARNIKEVRLPDSYKGKGIRYENEQIKTKAGKTGAK